MTQGVQEQIGILPAIEPEGHFIEVSREMFCADLVPCAHDAAFQKRECILDSIGVNVATNVLSRRVIDGFMRRFSNRMLVVLQAVSNVYIHVCAGSVTNVLRQAAGRGICSMKDSKLPS